MHIVSTSPSFESCNDNNHIARRAMSKMKIRASSRSRRCYSCRCRCCRRCRCRHCSHRHRHPFFTHSSYLFCV
ncbi:hypothetical protein PGB90_003652 [Kerria lacca]